MCQVGRWALGVGVAKTPNFELQTVNVPTGSEASPTQFSQPKNFHFETDSVKCELESNKVNAVSKLLSVHLPGQIGAWFILPCLLFALSPVPIPAATYSNTTPINTSSAPAGTIPYPSPITVSQLPGEITSVAVTLVNITHPNPDDLDVLLVGPGGQTVLLMSDAGGSANVTNVTVSFVDGARPAIPDDGPLTAGVYQPSNYDTTEAFPNAPQPPYGSKLNVFDGTNPNGVWRLFVLDDFMLANVGAIAGGWRLVINTTNRPPTITMPLVDQTAPVGATVTFKVGVDGTPPFGFQWLRDGSILVPFGQGTDTLRLVNVQPAQDGIYAVQITNGAPLPVLTASQARLNVIAPLQITEGLPPAINLQPGESVTLSVKAVGEPPIRYQWLRNGTVVSNATSSFLRLVGVTPFDSGNYGVIVWNGVETVHSGPTQVRVLFETTTQRPKDFFQERPHLFELDALNGVVLANSKDASAERDEPVEPGAAGRTMWLELTPPQTGIMTVRTRGSSFDTLLSAGNSSPT